MRSSMPSRSYASIARASSPARPANDPPPAWPGSASSQSMPTVRRSVAGSRPSACSAACRPASRWPSRWSDTALSGTHPDWDLFAGASESSPLSGLVVTALVLADDVQPVVGVDDGDEAHQRGELVVVIVLGRVRPGLVGDTAGGVGDAGALLGELERSPLGVGEDLRVPPRRRPG